MVVKKRRRMVDALLLGCLGAVVAWTAWLALFSPNEVGLHVEPISHLCTINGGPCTQ
jgi:hypothetical protein